MRGLNGLNGLNGLSALVIAAFGIVAIAVGLAG